MQRHKAFTKKTRAGKVVKVVKEHYLRDDIWCGSALCADCKHEGHEIKLPAQADQYIIVDTNVVLHQMDLLEHRGGAFDNVIFLQTVLEEVKHRHQKLYQRVRDLLASNPSCVVFSNEHHRSAYVERLPNETPNDRNDRCIRAAVRWYSQHLKGQMKVLLLTNDADNKNKALNESLNALTVADYVERWSEKLPELRELLAKVDSENKGSVIGKKRQEGAFYDEHLGAAELAAQLSEARVFQGTFKVNRDYYSEGQVSIKRNGTQERIFIPTMQHMNRAIDGDIVVIEILPKSEWKGRSKRLEPPTEGVVDVAGVNSEDSGATDTPSSDLLPTGKVVGIVERRWRPYCGSLEVSDRKTGWVLFMSVNRRIPRIRVESRQIEKLMDKRILVQIDSWPATSKHPLGHYVKTIGPIGDRDTETSVVLMEHDVPNEPWTLSVLKCLPPEDFTISDEERAKRVDLRETPIFSIDPPGCTDIDDALHVVKMPNGNYEVGVHIADVSHFVLPESAIDIEASNRGTSVYLVNKRIDMIPSLLSTDICSLRSGVERLTFSVVWEMNEEAEILDTKFFKSVIQSKAAFTYGQAQERIDSKDESDPTSQACIRLNNLAKKLAKKRLAAGALSLASTEVKFLLDKQSQTPMDVEMYQLKEANALVEQFMLLANVSVAKQILKCFPTFACLRRHPTPTNEMLEPLVRAAKTAGFDVKTSSSAELAASLDQCVIPGYPYFNKLIRILATRCMTQAVYFCSGDLSPKEYNHYGLASPVYTHFTSPIRRYADIVVHRLLAASLQLAPLPAAIQDRERMRDVTECINHRHRMAQLASRASTDLFTLEFFTNRRVVEEALITSVRSTGIRVLVPRYGIEGNIVLFKEDKDKDADDKDDDAKEAKTQANPYHLDAENLVLTGPAGTFKIFGRVQVEVYVQESKMRRRWLVIELVDKEKPTLLAPAWEAEKEEKKKDDGLLIDVDSAKASQEALFPDPEVTSPISTASSSSAPTSAGRRTEPIATPEQPQKKKARTGAKKADK